MSAESDLIKELQRKAIQFVSAGGAIIQAEARSRAPKDSGALINSILVETYTEVGRVSSETAPTVDYAEFMEYGTGEFNSQGTGRKGGWTYFSEKYGFVFTKGNVAQPYMEPGFQAAIPKIKRLERMLAL